MSKKDRIETEKKIKEKILEVIPLARKISIEIISRIAGLEFGKLSFTTPRLAGKRFSVGVAIYGKNNFSLTSSEQEIDYNLERYE